MAFSRARLAASALLFLGWLGFLAYLVSMTRDPVILSRPQFLVSDFCVVAEITQADGKPARSVHVTEVLWPKDKAKELTGKKIDIDELADGDPPPGWTGPQAYLLALTVRRDGGNEHYSLTRLPRMPGFQPACSVVLNDNGKKRVMKRYVPAEEAKRLEFELANKGADVSLVEDETRIYRATEEAMRQFHQIKP